jgi:hypothetical protein
MEAETEFETMVVDAIRSEWVRAGPVAVAGVVALAREIHPAQSKRIRDAVRETRALMDESEKLEFAAAMEGLRTEAKGLAAGEQVAAFVERSRTLATVGQQSTWLRPGGDAQSGARTGKAATGHAETR